MIRSLQIFMDLVESQSFTETGRRNYLTQSAVSQHLKALETKFGQQLLERGRQRVSMTPAGRLIYEAAKEIVWRYQRLERALERPPAEVSGALRIAAGATVGLYELPPYLAEFLKQYPNVALKLVYGSITEVYDAILANRADVGLVSFPEPHPQLIIQLFKRDRLVVIVPPAHPFASQKRISLKRLDGQPFIAIQEGPIREAFDSMLEQARARVRVVHEFDHIDLIKRAVEAEAGVAIVPRKTVVNEVQARTLVQLEITEGPFAHSIGILTRRGVERSLSAQKLITALLSPYRDESGRRRRMGSR